MVDTTKPESDGIDHQAIKDMVAEGGIDETQSKDDPDTPELTDKEKQAQEKGWVPEKEWKGDKDAWRPAKEFLDRGELIGKIMAQGRQLDDLQKAVVYMTEREKTQYLLGFNKAIEETKARRDQLLEEGEVREAAKIGDKLNDLKDQQREAKWRADNERKAPPPPSQEFVGWADRNRWYDGKSAMSMFADSVGFAFKDKNPTASEALMLNHVEREVKKEFEHKFKERAAPEPNGEGRTPRATSGRQSYSNVEAQMGEEERTIMRTIMKSAGISKEQYLKDYSENQ